MVKQCARNENGKLLCCDSGIGAVKLTGKWHCKKRVGTACVSDNQCATQHCSPALPSVDCTAWTSVFHHEQCHLAFCAAWSPIASSTEHIGELEQMVNRRIRLKQMVNTKRFVGLAAYGCLCICISVLAAYFFFKSIVVKKKEKSSHMNRSFVKLRL